MLIEQDHNTLALITKTGKSINISSEQIVTKNGLNGKELKGAVLSYEEGEKVLKRVAGTCFAAAVANYLRSRLVQPKGCGSTILPEEATGEWLEKFNEYKFPEMSSLLPKQDLDKLKAQWNEIKNWHKDALLNLLNLPVFQEDKYLVLPHPRMYVRPTNTEKFINLVRDNEELDSTIVELILERRIPDKLKGEYLQIMESNFSEDELYNPDDAGISEKIKEKLVVLAGNDIQKLNKLNLTLLATRSLYEINLLLGGTGKIKTEEDLMRVVSSLASDNQDWKKEEKDEFIKSSFVLLNSLVGSESTDLTTNRNIPDLLIFELPQEDGNPEIGEISRLKEYVKHAYMFGDKQPNIFADYRFVKLLSGAVERGLKINLAEIKTMNGENENGIEKMADTGKRDLDHYLVAVGGRMVMAYRRIESPDFSIKDLLGDPISTSLTELTTYLVGCREKEYGLGRKAIVVPVATYTDDPRGLPRSMATVLIRLERVTRKKIIAGLRLKRNNLSYGDEANLE